MQPLAKILANLLATPTVNNSSSNTNNSTNSTGSLNNYDGNSHRTSGELLKRQLLSQWPTIMGKLNTRMCVLRVQQNLIVLGVYDTAWMQELYCLSDLLLAQINQALNTNYFKALQFRYTNPFKSKIKPVSTNSTENLKHSDSSDLNSQNSGHHKLLSSPKLTSLERASLTKITDPELRSALQSFLVRCKT